MHRKGRVVLEQEHGVNMCEALLTAGNTYILEFFLFHFNACLFIFHCI